MLLRRCDAGLSGQDGPGTVNLPVVVGGLRVEAGDV